MTSDAPRDAGDVIDPLVDASWTRRQFLGLGLTGTAALVLQSCGAQAASEHSAEHAVEPAITVDEVHPERLSARPRTPTDTAHARVPGYYTLDLAEGRDGVILVPTSYRVGEPAPLALMLHGARGNARGGIAPFHQSANAEGMILLGIDAREPTWDATHGGGFGPDARFIDRALAQTFARYAVDPARVYVAGFSDGASYSLSLGLANGDLFSRIVAFSPGFIRRAPWHGKPDVFISHGTGDPVLGIDRTSRVIVPELRAAGYTVRYREFDGGHTIPTLIGLEAVSWLKTGGE